MNTDKLIPEQLENSESDIEHELTHDEALKKLIYACNGLSQEYREENYGEARNWMRHVDSAYSDYENVEDVEIAPPPSKELIDLLHKDVGFRGLDEILKPTDFGAIPDELAFTQEMADNNEFPPVSSVGVYSCGEGEVLKARLNNSGEKVIAVMNIESHKITWMPIRHLKPIDSRTDKEKLRDAITKIIISNFFGLTVVDALMNSDKFTITLN